MSGFFDRLQERREHLQERHEHGSRGHGREGFDRFGSEEHRGHHHHGEGGGFGFGFGEEQRHPQSYQTQDQREGRGYGYAPPSGPPPSSGRGGPGLGALGGLDRGDFASDADIDRMLASGELGGGQGGRQGYGQGGDSGERSRYDAPSGPPTGQGYGDRKNEYGRYDAPPGPPGYQSQQSHQQDYGPGGAHAPSYGQDNQHVLQQTQGRSRYESPQGPPPGRGPSNAQGNAPSGGFAASRGDGEDRYGSGYGGPPSNDRSDSSRGGDASSYYNQQGPGQGDRYAHLADMAQEHGDDPELYRRATLGLDQKIQSQAQSRRQGRDDDDFKTQVDAHRKAYGGDDHGPMDNDAIGAAAAVEAFKQTAATSGSSNAPAGAFKTGGDAPTNLGGAGQAVEEEEATAARVSGGGGLQDKLMSLAMSQAGKLFDKKNPGSSGGDASQGKAQAMQSAAATAMQLFQQYKQKGSIDPGDMQKVMGLAMNLF